jgi:hypothetical protein
LRGVGVVGGLVGGGGEEVAAQGEAQAGRGGGAGAGAGEREGLEPSGGAGLAEEGEGGDVRGGGILVDEPGGVFAGVDDAIFAGEHADAEGAVVCAEIGDPRGAPRGAGELVEAEVEGPGLAARAEVELRGCDGAELEARRVSARRGAAIRGFAGEDEQREVKEARGAAGGGRPRGGGGGARVGAGEKSRAQRNVRPRAPNVAAR